MLKLADTFALVEAFSSCKTIERVHDLVVQGSSKYGANFVFSGVIPALGVSAEQQMSHVLFGQWPSEWAQRYFNEKYLDNDPTIRHIRNKSSAVRWCDLKDNNSEIMNEARAFQLMDGFSVPMVTLDGVKMGMSFSGDKICSSPEAEIFFQVISAVSTAKVIELKRSSSELKAVRCVLTDRESECLQWVAEGKTNWEISVIFGVCEKTIEKHVSNCMIKLHSYNRTQLAVHALRSGLLQ